MKFLNFKISRILLAFALPFLMIANQAQAGEGDNYNFRFRPVLAIIGFLDAGFDFKIADQWSIGPDAFYWHLNLDSNDDVFDDYEITAFGLGVRANWFKNGAFTNGLYVGPLVRYYDVKVETTDALTNITYEGTANGFTVGSLVGYGWFWDSFNMMLGGGLSVNLDNDKIKVTNSAGETKEYDSRPLAGLLFEYSLGWSF